MSWYLNELKGEIRGRYDLGQGPIGLSIQAASLSISKGPACRGEVLENTQKGKSRRGIPRTEGHFTTNSPPRLFGFSDNVSVQVNLGSPTPCLSGQLVNSLCVPYVVFMGRKSISKLPLDPRRGVGPPKYSYCHCFCTFYL